MTMRAARVNESRSRLNAALSNSLRAEWWYAVEAALDGNHRAWPADVIEALMLAETEWRHEIGRIDILARTYACVPDDKGKPHCVLQITYARHNEPPVLALQDAASGQAGGSEAQVGVTEAPVRPDFSPSLCGIRHGAGWQDLAEE